MFNTLRTNLDQNFDSAIKAFGTSTIGSFDISPKLQLPQAINPKENEDLLGIDFQEIIDNLEAGASWLLEKAGASHRLF